MDKLKLARSWVRLGRERPRVESSQYQAGRAIKRGRLMTKYSLLDQILFSLFTVLSLTVVSLIFISLSFAELTSR
jgi:hypothetical protein